MGLTFNVIGQPVNTSFQPNLSSGSVYALNSAPTDRTLHGQITCARVS